MTFCQHCGSQIPEEARFCPGCGTAAMLPPPETPCPEQSSGTRFGTGTDIQECQDGKYRWVYELDMLTNPSILFVLLKVFGYILIGIWLFLVVLDLAEGNPGSILGATEAMLLVAAILLGLTILGYLLVAAIYRGKYVVLFEMDEKGVVHRQMQRQFDKAKVLSYITFMVGALAGKPGTMGAGILAGTKGCSTSNFSNVRSVKAYPRRHLIKVNEPFSKNQVYAPDKDFDFVYGFISSRCSKARVKRYGKEPPEKGGRPANRRSPLRSSRTGLPSPGPS